jgi:hypothetical protein
MKKNIVLFLLACCSCLTAGAYSGTWQELNASHVPSTGKQLLFPKKLVAYAINDAYVRPYLFSLNDDANANQQIELPTPDGGFRTFIIWKSQLMAEGLEAKYPRIRTFTAHAIDDQRVVAKIDYTLKGFHAMIYNGENTYFIDPYTDVNDGTYMCYYKRDFVKPLNERMICENKDDEGIASLGIDQPQAELANDEPLPAINARVLHGREKRTYRLALAGTYEYSVAVDGVTPTKAGVLSAMVTSVNRVTGVYETEMAISLQLVANTDTLIYITSADPYTNGNGGTMLGENQTTVTARIGSANYDIGHVFSTGGGGIASLGSICGSSKAQGVTGSGNPVGDAFDIDYVAHEMGHQFGGPHTFNTNTSGSCAGNRSGNNAYEPGSGSTIMAYAGICGVDNLQNNSDAYFHANSLQNIYNTITASNKNNCPVKTITGNAPSGIPAFTQTYSIPFLTAFELEAPVAIDSLAADTLTTYCWEQYDRGPSSTWVNAQATGPIFRSFSPTTSRIRVFPAINRIVNNVYSYVGEKAPPVARTLRFKLAVRSIYQGIGATNYSDDSIRLNVINTTTPFQVTAPNTAVTWAGGSTQTVTWDVSGTTATPISCANVDIRLSVDGGYTYPYGVVANVPNSGSATITVPNVPTTNQARIKVKGAGNVFFDISNTNFTINFNSSLPPATGVGQQAAVNNNNDVKIFPVPASDMLNITSAAIGKMNVSVYNAIGQAIWNGDMQSDLQLNVKDWAKGVYYIHFTSDNGTRFSKPVVVQ